MSMLASTSLRTEAPTEVFAGRAEFASDVRTGLSKPQKELHSRYLYDELGSALFDAITFLPEYGLTRADERLLETYAGEIVAALDGPLEVIELGSGNGRKTRGLLKALRVVQEDVVYYPIDVSSEALARCSREVSGLADVRAIEDTYLAGLDLALARRRPGQQVLVLFLGSTIGNFERGCAQAFLGDLSRHLQPGDALLLGADLVKSSERLVLAYDDPTGVTAAFNLNLLGRINRELNGNFDLRAFRHVARYNEQERRIEMHLHALADQDVTIATADFSVRIRAGDTIWTESSHKYTLAELPLLAARAGFRHRMHWVDQEWPFVEALWTVQP
jgi:L-histidine N-alpha-methyltransferase